jgi:ABC-type multidrug transport system fused ATPase/permease subunit
MRMHEVLLAIKLVKFYVWERSFARQVEEVGFLESWGVWGCGREGCIAATHTNIQPQTHTPTLPNPPPKKQHQKNKKKIRRRELELINASAVIKTLNLCLVFAVPPVIALVIYATYAYNVGPLTPAMSFVVLSLFNTLRFPLVVLPKALRGASEAAAAMARIQGYLELAESEAVPRSSAVEASFEAAELHYGAPQDFTLSVPDFDVKAGEVVAVVGRVGSGE